MRPVARYSPIFAARSRPIPGRLASSPRAAIGVQEPFAGTIRFKWLVRLAADEMAPFLEDPVGWIVARYGGGKFKMNLHHGMHFVSTKNFKPEGEPRWWETPELSLE